MAREDESVLTDSPTNSPVRGTGELFGRKAPSWLETVFRSVPSLNLATNLGEQGLGSAIPAAQEFGKDMFNIAPPTLLAKGVGKAHGFLKENVGEPLDEALGVTKGPDEVARDVINQVGTFATGGTQGLAEQGQPQEDADEDIERDEAAEVETLVEESQRVMLLEQSLKDMIESGDLTEQAQFSVNMAREQLADQMDQIQLDLEKARQQLQVQDAIFNFQADQLGMDPDLAPLEEALEQEGGVGLQTMQAIKDIANDASLSAAEKNEQVDLMMSRATFSEEITKGISEMVQNRDDLIKLNEMTDNELAQEMDVASFFDPQFDQVIEVDPVARFENTFDGVVENSPLGDTVAEMDDATFGLYENVTSVVNQHGVRSEQAAPLIQQLAQATGVDFETWRNTLSDAKTRADQTEAAFEASVDADSLTPGSEAMAFAIANAGQELIQAGVDPEQIRLLSNYAGLHGIIDVKSGGRAGTEGEGTIRGVGGLTEEMYEKLMGEPWTKDRGMEWELQALLLYIMRGFGGDPIEAIDFYRKTGEWGGVPSLGGEEVVDGQDLGAQAGK